MAVAVPVLVAPVALLALALASEVVPARPVAFPTVALTVAGFISLPVVVSLAVRQFQRLKLQKMMLQKTLLPAPTVTVGRRLRGKTLGKLLRPAFHPTGLSYRTSFSSSPSLDAAESQTHHPNADTIPPEGIPPQSYKEQNLA